MDVVEQDQELVEVAAGNMGEQNWSGCQWRCWMKFWK
jgi:hypothetical protein